MQRGEAVDLEAECRRHPQFAKDLRELWGVIVVARAAGSNSAVAAADAAAGANDFPSDSLHAAGAVWRLRAAAGAGPRRHGRRLSGPAGEPGPRSRREDDPPRAARLAGRPRAVRGRGRGGGPARSSGHRAGLRSRRDRRPAVLQHEARPRHDARPAAGRRAAAAARGGPHSGRRRPGDSLRPHAGRAAPRPQAVEHPARRARRAARHRLRPGQANHRRGDADQDRRGPRHAGLHGPGASRRAIAARSARGATSIRWA